MYEAAVKISGVTSYIVLNTFTMQSNLIAAVIPYTASDNLDLFQEIKEDMSSLCLSAYLSHTVHVWASHQRLINVC